MDNRHSLGLGHMSEHTIKQSAIKDLASVAHMMVANTSGVKNKQLSNKVSVNFEIFAQRLF